MGGMRNNTVLGIVTLVMLSTVYMASVHQSLGHITKKIAQNFHVNPMNTKNTEAKTVHSKAIMITTQRSGSTWLSSILNADNAVFSSEEMVHYSFYNLEKWSNVSWDTYKKDLDDAFLRVCNNSAFLTDMHKSGCGKDFLTGFKIMYDQIPSHLYFNFVDYIHENQIKVLHLVRETPVLKLMSRFDMGAGAHETNVSAVKKRNKSMNRQSIQKAMAGNIQLLSSLENEVHGFSLFLNAMLKVPFLEISYEHLTGEHSQMYLSIVDTFMGIRRRSKAHSKFVKIHSEDCNTSLPNWERMNNLSVWTRAWCYRAEFTDLEMDQDFKEIIRPKGVAPCCPH